MKVTLITGNEHKLRNVKANLGSYGIEVEGEAIDTPEIQASEVGEVAEYSAIYANKLLKKPVLKMDVGFEISCLGGFPGPFVKYINEWLLPEKILEMIKEEKDRKARFVDVVSYCSGAKKVQSFKMILDGTLVDTVRGENGWGIDKIFMPEGFDKTLAEMTDEERDKVWGAEHWKDLASYLKK